MIDLHLFEFPLNLIAAAAFLLAAALVASKPQGRSAVSDVLGGRTFSVVLLLSAALLMAVEGSFGLEIEHTAGFAAFVLLLMLSLSIVTVRNVRSRRPLPSVLSHGGLLLILFTGFFGAPDFIDARLVAIREEASHIAVNTRAEAVPLPFDVRLDEFEVDCYPDGVSPKQYSSTLDINGERHVTSVNHPCRVDGFLIYQSGYDTENGRYSVLKVVRDPWLPFVLLGMAVLAAGALLELRKTWNNRAVLPTALVLAVLFGFISLARINLGTLAPALRSFWFVPHLIIYMLAYSLMALSLVLGITSFFVKRPLLRLSGKLLRTSSSLLLLGMLCGAVWAKAAWGDYWTWDPKECWAAATWLLTLAGTHLPEAKGRLAFVASVLISFLAMQMTWYGVNYLPSSENSMHTYNSK